MHSFTQLRLDHVSIDVMLVLLVDGDIFVFVSSQQRRERDDCDAASSLDLSCSIELLQTTASRCSSQDRRHASAFVDVVSSALHQVSRHRVIESRRLARASHLTGFTAAHHLSE